MRNYQLFCLDDRDRIIRAEEFEAESDVDAENKAVLHCGDHAVELWADTHRVSSYRPSAHGPACTWGQLHRA